METLKNNSNAFNLYGEKTKGNFNKDKDCIREIQRRNWYTKEYSL